MRLRWKRNILFGTGLEFQSSSLPFHERHISPLHHHPHIVPASPSTTQLLSGKLNNPQTFDSSTVVEPPVLENESFPETEHRPTINLYEMLRKLVGGDLCHVVLAMKGDLDINGLQVGWCKCERLDGYLVASEGEFHPLTMSAIHADRSRSYLASIIVPIGGPREFQSNARQSYPRPHGDSKFVLNQGVLPILNVARVDYQTLCKHMSLVDTLDNGEYTGMGEVLVRSQKRFFERVCLLCAAAP